MRKLFTLLALAMGMTLMAQPNYKYIMAHMSEFSDGEAMYRLKDYQAWYPKQPHPYYLMANIHYRTYAKEHPLLNYNELSSALYNMNLYYGNCMHFLKDQSFKKEMYQEAADAKGKVTEESILAFCQQRRSEVLGLREKVDELYNSYTTLVNHYDSCLMEMTELSLRYSGAKEAQLLVDSADMALLDRMSERARQLPAEISRFKKALTGYPIEGYNPQFTFRPIENFRMEGLTTTNFLQNDVQLWDFVGWSQDFLTARNRDMLPYLTRLEQEYKRQEDAWNTGAEIKQNNLILNTIDHRDEGSAMSQLMRLQYLAVQARALSDRIMSQDSVGADEWVIMLQQNYRLLALQDQADQQAKGLAKQLNKESVVRKYAGFIARYFPGEEAWGTTAVSKWHSDVSARYEATCKRIVEMLGEHDSVVRISESTEAVVGETGVMYQPYVAPVEVVE